MSTASCIGMCSKRAVSHQTCSASRRRPSADANWSMMPEFTPTYAFSARCESSASRSRGSAPPASACNAIAVATSSAADDESPAPAGTSLHTATSHAGAATPASPSIRATPAT